MPRTQPLLGTFAPISTARPSLGTSWGITECLSKSQYLNGEVVWHPVTAMPCQTNPKIVFRFGVNITTSTRRIKRLERLERIGVLLWAGGDVRIKREPDGLFLSTHKARR